MLGSDWLVVTTLEPLARDLEANLDGEVLGDGEQNSPLASYQVDGLCPSTDE